MGSQAMKVLQTVFRQPVLGAQEFSSLAALEPNLVLVFGAVDAIRQGVDAIAQAFPTAVRAGCSTAGEISEEGVEDGTLVVTALRFDRTRLAQVSTVLSRMED